MIYVATEICDETGSWLSDFVLNEVPRLPKNKYSIILDKGGSPYSKLSMVHPFKTKRVIIRRLSKMEECLSYKLHTNRELSMMLSGDKPFAVFPVKDGEDYKIYNGQQFDKYDEIINSSTKKIGDIQYFFKFLDGEEWRLDAYCIVQKIRSYLGNCAQLEAMEGELLGYSSAQNMEYIDKFYRVS